MVDYDNRGDQHDRRPYHGGHDHRDLPAGFTYESGETYRATTDDPTDTNSMMS